jgi:hypothetical protein
MVPFTVKIKDFTLGLGTGAITIPQPPSGQSSSLTVPITLTALNTYNTSTALSCTGQPTGITCAFSPASGIPTALGLHPVLTVTSAGTVPIGTYHLQVKATAGTLIRTQALDVTDFGPNFTQAVALTTQNVIAGASTTYTVTFTPLGPMTQDIVVGCTLPPALTGNTTCSANPPTITPGVTALSSTVTLQTTFGTTPAANATVAITGVSAALNNLTRSTNVTLSVRDFTVTPNSLSVATNVGTNIADTIVVKGLNSFTGNVPLSCTIDTAPAGMGCALSNASPAASAAGTSVTATISSNMTTTPHGIYTVHVAGTVNGQVKTATFTVTVKDFTVGLGAAALTIPQPPPGQSNSSTTTIAITPLSGFGGGTITFSCAGLPAGMTCSFGNPLLITVNATSAVAAATYPITVKATSGTLVRQTNLDVTAFGPNFTQAVAPTTQNVTAGSSAAYVVTFTPLGPMTQDIAVNCVLPPALTANTTCSANPPTITPGVTALSSTLTLQTTFGTTPPANATVAITGISAALNNLTRSTNVTLSVKDFTVTANSPNVATNVGTNITDTIVVKGVNGFTGLVGLTCAIVEVHPGMNCTPSNLNPAASSTGTSVTATVSSDATQTPPGDYTVQVTGTTTGGSKMVPFTVKVKDFSLGIDQPSQQITATGTTVFAGYTLTASALNGFTSGVALSCVLPLPTGVTCGFGPSHVTSLTVTPTLVGTTVPFRITVTSSTAPNTYNLNIRGASGALIRLLPVSLQLQ